MAGWGANATHDTRRICHTRLHSRPMSPFRLFRRHALLWVACFAILLNALAPTVSQAVAASTGQTGWTQICSLAGLRWVQSSDDLANSQESGAPDQQFQTEQCPFCGVHAGSWVVLPEPPIAVAVASATDEAAPVPVLAHAHPVPPGAVIRSRAPPARS